jgi:cell division protease FtsH
MHAGEMNKHYSEAKAEEIDKEVFSIIDGGYKTAVQILTDHRDALERLAQALLEYETIDGQEVEMLVNGAAVSEIRKLRSNRGGSPGLSAKPGEATNEVAPVTKKDSKDPAGNTGPVTA